MLAINRNSLSDINFQQKQSDFYNEITSFFRPSPFISLWLSRSKHLDEQIAFFRKKKQHSANLLKAFRQDSKKPNNAELLGYLSEVDELIKSYNFLEQGYSDTKIKVFFFPFNTKRNVLLELITSINNDLYDLNIAIRKAVKRTVRREPSEEAIAAAQRSANTINAIYARH